MRGWLLADGLVMVKYTSARLPRHAQEWLEGALRKIDETVRKAEDSR
jgi:hypothetical protein